MATGVCAMHFCGAAAATYNSTDEPDFESAQYPFFLVASIVSLAIGACLISNTVVAYVTAESRDNLIQMVIAKRRLWRVLAQKEAAEDATALKSSFISIASHEVCAFRVFAHVH